MATMAQNMNRHVWSIQKSIHFAVRYSVTMVCALKHYMHNAPINIYIYIYVIYENLSAKIRCPIVGTMQFDCL